MNKIFITVKSKEYPLKFGFGVLKVFCAIYGDDRISAIEKRLAPLQTVLDDPTFEALEVIANIVLACIKYQATTEIQITTDDIIESIVQEPSKVVEIVTAFTNSMPKTPITSKKKKREA